MVIYFLFFRESLKTLLSVNSLRIKIKAFIDFGMVFELFINAVNKFL